jgi:hypothetical protein
MRKKANFDKTVADWGEEISRALGGANGPQPSSAMGCLRAMIVLKCASLDAAEKLRLMASITDLDRMMDGVEVEIVDTFPGAVNALFMKCVTERLRGLSESVAVSAFAAGFMPAAERLLSLAERAPVRNLVPQGEVISLWLRYVAIDGGVGTEADLLALLGLPLVLRRVPELRVGDGLREMADEFAEVEIALGEFKRCRDLLGLEMDLAARAFAAIVERPRAVVSEPQARLIASGG